MTALISASSLTIGILGGEGKFGRWMKRFFEAEGCSVSVSDIGTPLTNREVVARSSVVVVSLPIKSTASILTELQDMFRADQLLMDLTSVKAPLKEILTKLPSEILSLHPMFAPSVESVSGQQIISCPIRVGPYATSLRKLFEDAGARWTESTLERHDEIMALIQGVHHFSSIVLGMTMERLQFSVEEILPFMSPIYRMRMGMVGRILAQDPTLYADIAMVNPSVSAALKEFMAAAETLQEAIETKDLSRFVDLFRSAADHLQGFQTQAMEESGFLIDLLAKRQGG